MPSRCQGSGAGDRQTLPERNIVARAPGARAGESSAICTRHCRKPTADKSSPALPTARSGAQNRPIEPSRRRPGLPHLQLTLPHLRRRQILRGCHCPRFPTFRRTFPCAPPLPLAPVPPVAPRVVPPAPPNRPRLCCLLHSLRPHRCRALTSQPKREARGLRSREWPSREVACSLRSFLGVAGSSLQRDGSWMCGGATTALRLTAITNLAEELLTGHPCSC
jgi:hypothetical protein